MTDVLCAGTTTVTSAGSIDVSRATISFDDSSPRAGVFTIKTNQKSVAFQADTLEAAAQWVNELNDAAAGNDDEHATSHHFSALSTPFADQYKQIMCVAAAAAAAADARAAGTPRSCRTVTIFKEPPTLLWTSTRTWMRAFWMKRSC